LAEGKAAHASLAALQLEQKSGMAFVAKKRRVSEIYTNDKLQ
jgi:hypothetical protein